jgi:hypothetical protein
MTNLLRVALLFCDARCTFVQLRFSNNIAAARDGFSWFPLARALDGQILAEKQGTDGMMQPLTILPIP